MEDATREGTKVKLLRQVPVEIIFKHQDEVKVPECCWQWIGVGLTCDDARRWTML